MSLLRRDPLEDPSSIGNILKSMGAITEDDLKRALAKLQDAREAMLGKILVEQGSCSQEQVDIALAKQKALRGKMKPAEVVSLVQRTVVRHGKMLQGLDELTSMAKLAVKNGG